MSENGEIYTAGKNFTLPPGLTGWTNSTSAHLWVLFGVICFSFVLSSSLGATQAGGWWRSQRRSRIPIGLSKKTLLAYFFLSKLLSRSFQNFCPSCQKTIFTTSQPCCLQVPPQRRRPCHRGHIGRQNPRGSTRARIGLDLAAHWNGGSSWD